MKIVFDTNVYLAAVKKGSYSYLQLIRSRPNGPYQLYISPDIVLEIREKLETKFNFSRAESAHYLEIILMYAKLVHPKEKITGILSDEKDHIILECAVEAKAASIVTADKELLQLKEFREITIIHTSLLQYLK